ncbi:hypothetical protein JGH11_05520 [Dysgonomonas sp. Marseille-P4677]|uniref:alpha-2-macroglobulin family protein n=1 Tax=Dysgonomonas sp. Marseille-P4677 TaxID=2364790 RepID=UPI001912C542|nr:alpha-2-macroglobulin family protein [Dysgonomonas sp. Marseille-P4677]MBK5720323.1 hypothetical protein [Dysgonomonas sp. Marseille-P4677]
MKKKLLISLFFLLSISMVGQVSNNKYESDWKKVLETEEQDLPQSAIGIVEDILQKSIADKNTTQVIKSLIYKNKYKKIIDNQNNEQIFADLLSLVTQTSKIEEKALLYSMLAELYSNYYFENQWQINQRSNLTDVIPLDMKEWSRNIFADKITESLNLSISDASLLKIHTTKEYDDIILLGTDGQKYYPTLYDFLISRAIQVAKSLKDVSNTDFDLLSIGVSIDQLISSADQYIGLDIKTGTDNSQIVLQFYQQYLKDLLNRNLISTIILTELDKIDYLRQYSHSFSQEKVLDTYIALAKRHENNETSTEIINKITDSYNYTDKKAGNVNKDIYSWLNKGISMYPDSYGASLLKAKLTELESPIIIIKGDALQYPQKPIKISLHHKNVQALKDQPKFNLYKVENGKYDLLKDYPLNLVSQTTYQPDTLFLSLGALPVGEYCFTFLAKDVLEKPVDKSDYSNSTDNKKFSFIVSSLISYSRNSAQDEYEIFVVDRISGKPVKDALIKVYSYNQDDDGKKLLLKNIKTNEMGLAIFKDNRTDNVKNNYNAATYTVQLGSDSCLKPETLYSNNYKWNRTNIEGVKQDVVSVFTDRGIYRPGQTAYFKAIVLDSDSKITPNKAYLVKLHNANNEVVSEKNIITNEFGSVSGEFILPQSGLLGSYRIQVGQGAAYFNVEEYKRPTFEVTFDKVDKTYTFGEEVKLKGYAKNFSGISLQGADVKYTISREQFNFWYWRSGNKSHFADGIVKTNDDGSFEIVFTPEAGDGNSLLLRKADKQVFTFSVTATVTDINGETQSNTYTLTVGNVSMVINIDIPDRIEKASDYNLNIEARNLQAQEIETSGTYVLYKLDDNDSIQNKVLDGSFKTGAQLELKTRFKTLISGKYQLQVVALDSKNNEIIEKKNFIVFSYADKRPPIKTSKWLVQKNTTFGKDNKPVEVIFGTTDKETYVLYQLSNNKQIFERRFQKLSNTNHTFTIPYKAEYGDEISMTLTSVKEGELYNESIFLQKEIEKTDTKLNLKLEVFRDKLRPGQAETWTVSVKDSTEKPILAELLASMYDSSLDKLYSYTAWSLNRPQVYKEYIYPINYHFPWYNNDKWLDLDYNISEDTIPVRTFDIINWFGYINQSSGGLLGLLDMAPAPRLYGSNGIGQFNIRGTRTLKQESAVAVEESALVATASDQVEFRSEWGQTGIIGKMDRGGSSDVPQLRQNFNETAFFYPQLRTNEKGEVQISFTVPESNTTWRFRALAHDRDARVGVLEQMVVTRKELMVTPNMPRFIRQGDKTSISTKISNLSDKAISGNVHIEFFDPMTDKVVDLNVPDQQQSFSLEKDASTSASWIFNVPSDIELIGCRIVAQNGSFSDGEQHVLAVLSNRMLVTESMTIDVTKQGTSSFTFDKLYSNNSNSASYYRLTLEYASNPAWYAIQALPTMSNPSNENAVNWFASYYVNTLGASIVRQYPKVAATIQSWLKQGGDKQTLISKLQKDEELKAVLLEETPWVLDAKNETEQMQRLSLLFDLNNTKQLTDAATRKLAELMNNEGGWSWYKGLYPSRSISQYILYGYAKLQEVGRVEYPQEVKEMQMKALKYVDNQIVKDFENLKKHNKEWEKITSISTNQLEFAYIRSFYRDIPISQEARAAERFYTNVASKNWTKLNLYERSILSLVLKQNGEKDLANKIVKSIKEYALKDTKLGMYWPNNRSHVFMSMSAISVHTFLMDALEQNGATTEEMDLMKKWLINQKRTQVWESTHASIDAINALLSSGTNWFINESSSVTIKVGNTKIEPENKELGTGYIKQTWDKSEIKNNMGKVEITTPISQPAYGAMYWQYYENLDKITVQKGDLNVDKQLFKENVSVTGKGLVQIAENNPLIVGDKVIVRLTVRIDRDMDFVQLKDMRAPCFEPQQTISNGLIYYQMVKDASTNFYFDHLPKGTYVLEYPVYVNRSGEYANGITTIQCMYAPEFISHTQGIKVTVKDK